MPRTQQPSGSSGRWGGGDQVRRLRPMQRGHHHQAAEVEGHEREVQGLLTGLSPVGGRPRRGLWSPAGHRPQPAPAPQLTCWPEAR